MGDKAGWIGEARARPVVEVAEALGLKPGARGKGWGPCPACSATTRGTNDKRGPVGLGNDGRGWECYRCGAKGDGVALVAYALGHGERQAVGPVAAWFRVRGWVADRSPSSTSRPVPVRPVVAPPPAPAPAPPARLDPAEVRALWAACPSVEVEAVAPWFDVRARGLGLDGARVRRVVEALDLARSCVRVGLDLPAWARIGRTSWAEGWPLVLPCHNAEGELVALRALRTDEGLADARNLPVAWYNGRKVQAVGSETTTWRELCARLTSCPVLATDTAKDAAPWWSPVEWGDGRPALRANDNVSALSCVVLDFDDLADEGGLAALAAAAERLGRAFAWHTSWSHAEDKPKARLILPLDRPCPAVLWPDLWGRMTAWARREGLTADPKCRDVSRAYVLPCALPDRVGRFASGAGGGPRLTLAGPCDDEVGPAMPDACRGTVYADPLARAVLAAGGRARRGDALLADAPDLRWSGRVLVVEGGPAFLRFAADLSRVRVLNDHAEAPAVVGVWSGAWPDDEVGDELAARFAGAVVGLAPGFAKTAGSCLSRAGVPWKPWTW